MTWTLLREHDICSQVYRGDDGSTFRRDNRWKGGQSMSQLITVKSESLARVSSWWLLVFCPQPSDPPMSCPWWRDKTSTAAWCTGASRWFSRARTLRPSPRSCSRRRPQVGPLQLVRVPWPCESHHLLVLSSIDCGWISSCRLAHSSLFPHRDKSPMSLVILMLTQFTTVWMCRNVF